MITVRQTLVSVMLVAVMAPALSGCPFVTHTLEIGGVTRFYLLDEANRLSKPAPAVVVLHGFGGSAQQVRASSRFHLAARRNGFIAAFPDGLDRRWRFEPFDGSAEDLAFIDAVVDALIDEHGADPDRIYFVGVSNGALMTWNYVCGHSERVSAIAPVIGATMPESVFDACDPTVPVGIFALHNSADMLLPPEGGTISRNDDSETPSFETKSIEDSLALWAAVDGCATSPAATVLDSLESIDGLPVIATEYADCFAGSPIQWYAIDGGGHEWPEFRDAPAGGVVDTAQRIWDFFDSAYTAR